MRLLELMHRPLILIFILVLAACGGDDNPAQSGQTAKIEGRVTNNTGFETSNSLAKTTNGVEGATVTAAQFQSDGSLNTISNASVETDAQGEFVLETDLDGVSNLIVLAQKGSAEWKAVLSSEVNRGSTTKCQPHNEETTSEADLHKEHVKRGKDDDVSYSDVAVFVNAEVAASINGDASAISEVASALEAEADARAKTFTHASIGATQSQLQTANDARTDAQAALEVALNEAGENQSAIEAAFENYHEAIINAYVNAGISAESHAKSRQTSSQALLKSSANLNSDAQLALTKSAAELRARATDRACQSQFNTAGASSAQLNAVINAGTTLRSSIQGASSESQITAAFAAYHDAILSELQATMSGQAAAIVTMDAAINGAGGAKLALDSAVSTAATTEALVQAYVNFYSAVRTLVETTLSTATNAEIEVITEVMILVNM